MTPPKKKPNAKRDTIDAQFVESDLKKVHISKKDEAESAYYDSMAKEGEK